MSNRVMTEPIASDAEEQTHPATSVLFITVMIDLIGFGIVLPLLPSYAARFQVSETAIGIVVGSFSLMQFLLAPWWGRLSDRIGRRPVLLVGLAGSCLSYLLFALAGSFWILLLSRMLAGGMGATVNVAQAYLADVTPAHRRARAMGLIGAAFGLGFVLGPAIAGLTIRWGTRAPGLVAASISLASFTLAWWRLPETRVHQPVETTRFADNWTRLAGPYSIMFLVILAFTVMTVVFPLYSVRVLGYDQRTTSSFFVLLGVVSALIQGWLLGKLTRRIHESALIATGGGFLAVGLALIPVARLSWMPQGMALPTLVVGLVCIAIGTGLATPSITGFVSRRTPPSRQGVALGTLQSIGSVARIVGPPATGFLTEISGERVPFLAGSAVAFAALVIAVVSRAETGE
jgi:MFS transporter, DHA1 family, tetracycline resistance protein